MKAATALLVILLAGLVLAQTNLDGLDNDNFNQYYNESMDDSYQALDGFPEIDGLVSCPTDLGDALCSDETIQYWIEVELANINNLAEGGRFEDVILRSNELADEVSALSVDLGLSPSTLARFTGGLTAVSDGLSFVLTGVVPDAVPPETVEACDNAVVSLPLPLGVLEAGPPNASGLASQPCVDFLVNGLASGSIDGFGLDWTFKGPTGTYPVTFVGEKDNTQPVEIGVQNTMGVPSFQTQADLQVYGTDGGLIDSGTVIIPALDAGGMATVSFDLPHDIETVFTLICIDCEPFTGVVGPGSTPAPTPIITPVPRLAPVPPTVDYPLPPSGFCPEGVSCSTTKTNGTISVFDKETGRLVFSLKNDGQLAFKLADTQKKLTFAMVQEKGQGVVFANILDDLSLNRYKEERFNAYAYGGESGYAGQAYAFGQLLDQSFNIGAGGQPADGLQRACETSADCLTSQICVNRVCQVYVPEAEIPVQ